MINYNSNDFIRNKEIISKYFKTVGNIVYTNNDIHIYFPERYVEAKLATLGRICNILGIYIISNNKKEYSLINTSIFHNLVPSHISNIFINDDPFIDLFFKKDSVFIPDNRFIVTDSRLYDIFNEFIIKGNIPFFLNYNDISNIYANTNILNNNNIGDDTIGMEIVSSVITRYDKDYNVHYREVLDNKNAKHKFISLNDIIYAFDNTGSKLIGGYFNIGVPNAMVSPEKKTSLSTKLLRS